MQHMPQNADIICDSHINFPLPSSKLSWSYSDHKNVSHRAKFLWNKTASHWSHYFYKKHLTPFTLQCRRCDANGIKYSRLLSLWVLIVNRRINTKFKVRVWLMLIKNFWFCYPLLLCVVSGKTFKQDFVSSATSFMMIKTMVSSYLFSYNLLGKSPIFKSTITFVHKFLQQLLKPNVGRKLH